VLATADVSVHLYYVATSFGLSVRAW